MHPFPDRREFAAWIAAALAAVGLPNLAAAQKLGAADAKRLRDALDAMVQIRFGGYLTREQKDEVVQSLVRGFAQSQELARFPLPDQADPAEGFRADLP